jgi:hypothetical protein
MLGAAPGKGELLTERKTKFVVSPKNCDPVSEKANEKPNRNHCVVTTAMHRKQSITRDKLFFMRARPM